MTDGPAKILVSRYAVVAVQYSMGKRYEAAAVLDFASVADRDQNRDDHLSISVRLGDLDGK